LMLACFALFLALAFHLRLVLWHRGNRDRGPSGLLSKGGKVEWEGEEKELGKW